MGIGGEGDGDVGGGGELEEFEGGVLLGAGLVEAGGVELDGTFGIDEGLDDGVVESFEVALGAVGEFFDEVGVAEEVEESAAGHFFVFLPVGGPGFLDVGLGPAPEPCGVIEVPAIEVVDGTDEVVPIEDVVEVDDPLFAVGKPVALESGADGDFVCGVGLGLGDPLDVDGEVFDEHAPVIEGLGTLGGVIGDAVFGDAGGDGGIDVFFGFAFGVVAQGGVGVIICRHGVFGVVALTMFIQDSATVAKPTAHVRSRQRLFQAQFLYAAPF